MSQTKAQLISGSSSQDVTFDDATVSSLNGGPLAGARNRIINGDMRIDQRNAGAAVTPTANTYTADRFQFQCTQASKILLQRTTSVVNGPPGFPHYLLMQTASAYSSAASDVFALRTTVEGLNMQDFAWGTANAKTVTLSFWVWAAPGSQGTYGASLVNGPANRSYPFSYTISAASTWQYITVTIPGDTAGTWAIDNTVGASIYWNLGSGSNFFGTANTWSTGNYVSPSGTTSLVGNASGAIYITGVQLETGTIATPFEIRPYPQELALCQRYFESSYVYVSNAPYQLYYKVSKRVAPTVAGGGAGFSSAGVITTEQTYTSQTTGAFQTLTFASEL